MLLWNGAGLPDIEFPDMMAEVGLHEQDVVYFNHRYLLPYPAKHFAENIADGAHFAVAMAPEAGARR